MTRPSLTPDYIRARPRWLRLAGGVVALVFLLGGGALVLSLTFTPFLASPAWTRAARPFAIGFGIVFAAAALPLAAISLRGQGRGRLRTGSLLLFGAALFWVIGAGMVYEVPPMLRAALAGGPVTLDYVVTEADFGGRYCRRRVRVAALPFLFDALCGVPDDLRSRLHRGSRIRVAGRGTGWGLYPETVAIAGP